MSDEPTAMPTEAFQFFSNEYAQALQAYSAIEAQAANLLLTGNRDALRGFVEQFIGMALRTKAMAQDQDEANFITWFDELIAKAEKLRADIG